MTDRPAVRWVEVVPGGFVLEHEGPCVFVDGECSCGVLDLGLPVFVDDGDVGAPGRPWWSRGFDRWVLDYWRSHGPPEGLPVPFKRRRYGR